MTPAINGGASKNVCSKNTNVEEMEREFERCADIVDQADVHIENAINDGVGAASRAVAMMPVGNPGDCDFCGEYSGRLVKGACSPCRDKWGLK